MLRKTCNEHVATRNAVFDFFYVQRNAFEIIKNLGLFVLNFNTCTIIVAYESNILHLYFVLLPC